MAVSYQQRSARMAFVQDHGGGHAPASPSLFLSSSLGFLSWSPNFSSLSYFPVCELLIVHPESSPSPWCSLQHPSPKSQWSHFSHSLCSSPPSSTCKAPSSQVLSSPTPIFVLASSAFDVGTSFSMQPGHQAGECQKARRDRHHVLPSCTDSHPGYQQQDMVTVRKDLWPSAGSRVQG